jgi:hypothetical protein
MTEGEIDISGFDKADVLVALYNQSRVQGLGAFHATGKAMERSEATDLLKAQTYFDYLHGKVMKVELSGDSLRPFLYDRDNGTGAAEAAIASISQ